MATDVVHLCGYSALGKFLRLQNQKISTCGFVFGFIAPVCVFGKTANSFNGTLARSHRDVGDGHFWQHARQRYQTLSH